MNATTGVLLLGGAVVLGGGIAMAQQKVTAEKTPTQTGLPEGTKFAGNEIPTHTTDPEAEKQMATWRQLLVAYKSDITNLQSQRANLTYELTSLEQQIGTACSAYAQSPRWGCDSEGFLGQSNRCTIKGREQDMDAYSLCRSYGTGNTNALAPSRDIPFQESFSLAGRWRDAYAVTQYNDLLSEISSGYNQASELRRRYQAKQAEIRAIDDKIADLQKKIADLNARGVY